METSAFNLVTALIAFFAIVISLIGIAVSVVNSMKSDMIAMDANAIAKTALEFAKFGHKERIAPSLIMTFQIIPTKFGVRNMIYLKLENEKVGSSIINSIECSGHLQNLTPTTGEPIDRPFQLLQNNSRIFTVEINHFMYDDENIKESAISNGTKLEEEYKIVFKNNLLRSWFKIHYTNELKIPYEVNLTYDLESAEYNGKPIELGVSTQT